MSTYYGVFGIPTVFLVGADGKVISIHARGEELDNALKKLLGPPKAKAEKAQSRRRMERQVYCRTGSMAR